MELMPKTPQKTRGFELQLSVVSIRAFYGVFLVIQKELEGGKFVKVLSSGRHPKGVEYLIRLVHHKKGEMIVHIGVVEGMIVVRTARECRKLQEVFSAIPRMNNMTQKSRAFTMVSKQNRFSRLL